MKRGTIPINKNFELEYRYYDKDANYKYFNRKFEIYLLEKKTLRKNYVLHMDNCEISEGKWSPHIHKAKNVNPLSSTICSLLIFSGAAKGLFAFGPQQRVPKNHFLFCNYY